MGMGFFCLGGVAGDPIRNVPRSVKQEGHIILGVQRLEDDTYKLLVRKVGE